MASFLHRTATGGKSFAVKRFKRPSQPAGSTSSKSGFGMEGLQIGLETTMGIGAKKIENQDRAVYEFFTNQSRQVLTAFAAVFDGHGGSLCSDYISKVVGKHLQENFVDDFAWDGGDDVLREVFYKLDKEFNTLAMAQGDFSGSCATILAIRDDEFIIGNIGDCRAIQVPITASGSHGEVVDLTPDHRANGIYELHRINSAGGEVKSGRIGALEPSRTFGDIDVKRDCGKDVVTCNPDVDRVFVHQSGAPNSDRPFTVVCSDGVWDVLSSKEVAAVAKATLKKMQYNPSVCASKIVEAAKNKGSQDDITCLVLVW